MKILLVHQYFLEPDNSGGSRFNEMARLWSELGHEVTVLAGMIHANSSSKREEYRGKYFVHKQHDKVSVWRCHVPESYNKSFGGRLWGYFAFVFSSLFAGFFRAGGGYDLILVTSPPLFVGITAYILSRVKRVPYVFEIRDLWPESAVDTGVITNSLAIGMALRLERFVYRKARLINVLTPAFRDILTGQKKVPPGKVVFIPNAADFSLSDKLLPEFDPEGFRKIQGIHEKFVITYVGAHGLANDLLQIIDAAEKLKDTNAMFLLIGDGMQKNMLIETAQRRSLDNIRFIGPLPKTEVFRYIIASDLGASVLKKADTFRTIYSNKTFDYMACRKPVLMVIDGISRELVETARCGVFAEPGDPADIACKIRECMADPAALNKMGENGYRYAKLHFDRSVLAGRYMQHLEDALKS